MRFDTYCSHCFTLSDHVGMLIARWRVLPRPGATLGIAMTMAYIAGRHAASRAALTAFTGAAGDIHLTDQNGI